MSTFRVSHVQRQDNFAVVQTVERTDIGIGQTVTVSNAGTFNGPHVIYAVPIYEYLGVDDEGDFIFNPDEIRLNQLLFASAGDDVAREALDPFGLLSWTPTCTWVTNQMVIDWLGIASATANDTAFITKCVAAANAYASRRRREAGYFDSLTSVPGGDVELGTIMYAAALYRERGSVDSFASFEQMGTPVPFGSHGQINRLLGINRSQVA